MKKNRLFIAALFVAASLTMSACNTESSNGVQTSDDPTSQTSNVNPDIYKIYQLYQASGGDLSYDEWLKSIKGEKGDQGEPGKDGTDGQDGRSPVVTIGSDGYWYIDDVNTNVKAQGEQGLQGVQGETGPQGPQGSQGPKGDKGDTGATGPQGSQGPQGEKGDTGAQGPQGDQGEKGDTGAQGPKGDTGAQGPKGDQGEKGDTGETGPKGDKGDTGETGAQGPKGDIGETGAQGPKGDQGDKGDTGEQGPKGDTGETGLSAYEIFLKYHPDYLGTEEDWINDVAAGNHCNLFGHDYEVVVTKPSCLTGGYTTKTCRYCGDMQVTDPTEALGHDYTNSNCCIRCGLGEASQGLEFTISEDGTFYKLSGIGECTDDDIIVPSYHDSLPVKEIADYAFENNVKITSVNVDKTITKIGRRAFKGCRVLRTFNFTDYLEEIGEEAFRDCTAFSNFTFPNGLTSIGGGAFAACVSITEIDLPAYVANMAVGSLFEDCTALKVLRLPQGVTRFGGNEFCGCYYISVVLYAGSLEEWRNIDFAWNNNTVSDCTGLICDYVSGYVSEGDFSYYLKDNKIYCLSVNNKNIDSFDVKRDIGDYELISIATEGFKNCENIRSIELPESLEILSKDAFCHCMSLRSVVLNGRVSQICNNVFGDVWGSAEFHVYVRDQDYDYYTNYNDSSWQIWCVGCNCVYRMEENNSSSGLELFDNGDGTYSVLGRGTCQDRFIAIPENVTSIAAEAFSGSNIISVTMSDNVETVGNNAFYNCDSLEFVTLNEGLTAIGNNAFFHCGRLYDIEIPASVLTIGDNAFMYTPLESVVFADNANVTSFGAYAFSNCPFESFIVPDSVETIGQQCFDNCNRLRTINLNNATSIGYQCFASCTRLESIVIGHEMDRIGNLVGDCGFSTCTSLTRVYFEGNQTEWNAISLNQEKATLEAKGLYFYSENEPGEAGNYWHYVDGVPTIW